jgi:hypothetical protein
MSTLEVDRWERVILETVAPFAYLTPQEREEAAIGWEARTRDLSQPLGRGVDELIVLEVLNRPYIDPEAVVHVFSEAMRHPEVHAKSLLARLDALQPKENN